MAKTVVGGLTTVLTVNSGPFSKGMATAKKTTSKFAGGIAALGKKLAKFAAISLAAVVAGLVALTIKSLSAVDAVAKLSKTLDIAIDDLRGLRLMATESGASVQDLDKAISRMSRNIGEAALGTSEATDALRTLGLEASALEQLGTLEQFKAIADGIARLPNAMQQASVSADLFGRSGQKLVLMFRQGSAGIDEMIKVTKTLRGSLSAIDARQVELLNDQWGRVKQAVAGVGDKLAIYVASMLGGAIPSTEKLGSTFATVSARIIETLDVIIQLVAGLLEAITKLAAVVVRFGGFLQKLFGFLVLGLRVMLTGAFALVELFFGKLGQHTFLDDILEDMDSFIDRVNVAAKSTEALAKELESMGQIEAAASAIQNARNIAAQNAAESLRAEEARRPKGVGFTDSLKSFAGGIGGTIGATATAAARVVGDIQRQKLEDFDKKLAEAIGELRELNRTAETALNQGAVLRGIREVVRKVDDLTRVRH